MNEKGQTLFTIELIVACFFGLMVLLISPKIQDLTGMVSPFLPVVPQSKTSQSVPVAADKTAPKRLNLMPSFALPAGSSVAVMSLETNEPATCRYSEVPGLDYNSMINSFSATNATFHSVLIKNIVQGTVKKFYIRCKDQSGNKNTTDAVITIQVSQ